MTPTEFDDQLFRSRATAIERWQGRLWLNSPEHLDQVWGTVELTFDDGQHVSVRLDLTNIGEQKQKYFKIQKAKREGRIMWTLFLCAIGLCLMSTVVLRYNLGRGWGWHVPLAAPGVFAVFKTVYERWRTKQ